jgi:hypothetical protein
VAGTEGNVEELRHHPGAADIGPKTCASGTNDPMDLDLALDILLSVTGFS